jgi:hypothetical protein
MSDTKPTETDNLRSNPYETFHDVNIYRYVEKKCVF